MSGSKRAGAASGLDAAVVGYRVAKRAAMRVCDRQAGDREHKSGSGSRRKPNAGKTYSSRRHRDDDREPWVYGGADHDERRRHDCGSNPVQLARGSRCHAASARNARSS